MEIKWLTPEGQLFLERDYLLPGQTVEERLNIIGNRVEEITKIEGIGKKVAQYIANGWISPSTPIWTNFGTTRGLPISCFGSYVPDSVEGILKTISEIGMMCKHGGGTSGYFGDIRERGSKISTNGTSNGSKPFLQFFQEAANTINQGTVRRGYFAGYIDIDHGDFDEWCNIRAEGDAIQHITWGVCVKDKWLEEMEAGDAEKRKKWAKVIKKRLETGLPYLWFTDNANNGESVPEVYKGKGLIKASQMCNEISLPSNEVETFVCDLASLNDRLFEEWVDTDCVFVAVALLDASMTEFIERASDIFGFERAVNFAKRHRALGLGRLGYHSFLQSKMIPFESLEARNWNVLIQKTIKEQAYAASEKLAELFGEPEVLEGIGRRNSTLIALPPTTSTAFIFDESQSIEIREANIYIKDIAKIKAVVKNKYLEKLLEEKGENTEEIWDSIMHNHGSVQHLDFLSDREKLIFRTAHEVDQNEVILQAAQRQKYIDQGQSLNVFIGGQSAKEINALILKAHKLGLKGLYYQHNVNAAQQLTRQILTCASCE